MYFGQVQYNTTLETLYALLYVVSLLRMSYVQTTTFRP